MVCGVTQPALPSGEQHEIRWGEERAVIVEVGGGLRTYETEEGPVLDGYGRDERCGGGRGQPLMPWPNRVRDGRYEFDGSDQQLPITEVETQTAIHGLVRWANWTVSDREENRVVMAHRLHPQPGWPGVLDLAIEYALDEAGLTVVTTVTNAGGAPCPFGAGFHPYLSLGATRVDAITLQAPARRYLEADEQGLPTGVREVADTSLDYRQPRNVGDARLDTCFTDLVRDSDRLARVRMWTPAREATLWLDDAFTYLMLFTGDTLPPDHRRRGLAIEPMSCPPDALRSGEGLIRLEPGDRFTARWGISPRT
jgi:aldose 1-epimerase